MKLITSQEDHLARSDSTFADEKLLTLPSSDAYAHPSGTLGVTTAVQRCKDYTKRSWSLQVRVGLPQMARPRRPRHAAPRRLDVVDRAAGRDHARVAARPPVRHLALRAPRAPLEDVEGGLSARRGRPPRGCDRVRGLGRHGEPLAAAAHSRADMPWRRVAATPRRRREYSVETGSQNGETGTFREDG